jgi:hypothetical protein
MTIPQDQACTAIEVRCSMKVQATAGYTTAALTSAKIDALLKGIAFDFSCGGDDDKSRLEPFQNVNFWELARLQESLLEKLVQGASDSTAGLTKPVASNTITTLAWKMLIPFDVEVVEPGVIYGMGASQLASGRLTVRMGADPLTAVDTTLSVLEIALEFWPVLKQTNGDQVSPLIFWRKKTDPGKLGMSFPDGCYIQAFDLNRPLATTLIDMVTVKVGDETVCAPPGTPKDIDAAYLELPDVRSTEDLSEYWTTLYRIGDTLLGKLRTGPFSVEQREQKENLNVGVAFFPVLGEAAILRDIQAAALRRRPGERILAVMAPALDNVTVESRHLPFAPYRIFEGGERQAEQYAGLSCEYGATPEVFIPEGLLDRVAARYLDALRENDGAGNEGVMLDTIRSVADMVPGSCISGRGYKGGRSAIYAEVERKIMERVNQKAAEAAALAAALSGQS